MRILCILIVIVLQTCCSWTQPMDLEKIKHEMIGFNSIDPEKDIVFIGKVNEFFHCKGYPVSIEQRFGRAVTSDFAVAEIEPCRWLHGDPALCTIKIFDYNVAFKNELGNVIRHFGVNVPGLDPNLYMIIVAFPDFIKIPQEGRLEEGYFIKKIRYLREDDCMSDGQLVYKFSDRHFDRGGSQACLSIDVNDIMGFLEIETTSTGKTLGQVVSEINLVLKNKMVGQE